MHNPLPPVLSVIAGGTGASLFAANQILYGNGIGPVQSSSDFAWNETSKVLTVGVSTITSSTDFIVQAALTRSLQFNAGTGSGGNGGAVTMISGAGNSSGNGGAFSFTTGQGAGSGNGGAMTLLLGRGGNTGGQGGTLTFTAGDGGITTGGGGGVSVSAGFASTSGAGGNVSFTSGDAAGLNKDAGTVTFNIGARTGAGLRGYIYVNGSYAVAAGTGTVTMAQFPIVVDGSLYYINLLQ